MFDPIYIILSTCAVIVMCYALYRVVALNKRIPGGVVKSSLNLLAELIGVCVLGYVVMPFMSMLPQISQNLIIGIILFVAAVFVVIVVDLFTMVITDLGL